MITMNRIIVIFIIVFSFSSCKKHFFEQKIQIPDKIWDVNQHATFTVEIKDIETPYNMYLNFDIDKKYPYSNLWVFIKSKSPSGMVTYDTLNCEFLDEDYKWKGKCGFSDCNVNTSFVDSVFFPEKGEYTFEIQQGLRIDKVEFIKEIGFLVDKL